MGDDFVGLIGVCNNPVSGSSCIFAVAYDKGSLPRRVLEKQM